MPDGETSKSDSSSENFTPALLIDPNCPSDLNPP